MKYYEITLSSKDRITIDEDDYRKFIETGDKSRLIQLKKAVINPSFIVTIIPISQSKALENETPLGNIKGQIDEKTRKFITTKDMQLVPTKLKDEF